VCGLTREISVTRRGSDRSTRSASIRLGSYSLEDRDARAGPRASYLPATLVTGIPPMTVPGLDLASEPGVAAAIDRPRTLYQVTATSLARPREELAGLFLVQSAPRLTNGIVRPGYVALFVPESWLRAAATGTERLELRVCRRTRYHRAPRD
jgi:hypothetical protein